jgi:hypothetical protein
MIRLFSVLCAFAAAFLLQAGLSGSAVAQGTPPAPSGGASGPPPGYASGPPSEVATPSPSGAPQPFATPPELPVLWITSVEVIRGTLEPRQDIVRVRGVTGSMGWSAPQLVPLFIGDPADHILDLQFIAQTPADSQPAQGFVPISAILPLDPGHPFTGVRVRSAGNVVEVTQIPGSTEAKITIEDCSKCVGKKFASKGKVAAGTAGVVREEEMPRNFRVIPPKKGVAGITHNMNRLNIVLGDDGETIVWAFWE